MVAPVPPLQEIVRLSKIFLRALREEDIYFLRVGIIRSFGNFVRLFSVRFFGKNFNENLSSIKVNLTFGNSLMKNRQNRVKEICKKIKFEQHESTTSNINSASNFITRLYNTKF